MHRQRQQLVVAFDEFGSQALVLALWIAPLAILTVITAVILLLERGKTHSAR